ncbi:MAG: alpha/beta hydrolase family protein [Blastocatellia bacterium]
MTGKTVKYTDDHLEDSTASQTAKYDPFVRGRFPVGVRTVHAFDAERNRTFPCEIWYPAAARYTGQDLATQTQDVFAVPPSNTPRTQLAVRDATALAGAYPLIVFSHHSGGNRRSATFLCTHLSSHGYVAAAMNHSEVVAQELARQEGETVEQKDRRWRAVIASRVPDVRFLLDRLLNGAGLEPEIRLDSHNIGIVGHSFGGWTALASPDEDRRIRAIVALAPGGATQIRPGVLPVTLSFNWGRDVPTLFLVAENDVPLPLTGMYEIFQRTRSTKRMVILRRADHLHFVDNVEQEHEAVRTTTWPAELGWIQREMRPIAELCSGQQAQLFVRGLTLCHMDAILRRREEAQRFLTGDIEAELKAVGVEVVVYDR